MDRLQTQDLEPRPVEGRVSFEEVKAQSASGGTAATAGTAECAAVDVPSSKAKGGCQVNTTTPASIDPSADSPAAPSPGEPKRKLLFDGISSRGSEHAGESTLCGDGENMAGLNIAASALAVADQGLATGAVTPSHQKKGNKRGAAATRSNPGSAEVTPNKGINGREDGRADEANGTAAAVAAPKDSLEVTAPAMGADTPSDRKRRQRRRPANRSPDPSADDGRAEEANGAAAAEAVAAPEGSMEVNTPEKESGPLDVESSARLQKRQRSSSPAKACGGDCSQAQTTTRGFRLSDKGREYRSRLAAKFDDNGLNFLRRRNIKVQVMERAERQNADVSTSSGRLSEKSRRARLEDGREIRFEYHNFVARRHRECKCKHPFGSQCALSKTTVDGKLVYAGLVDPEGSKGSTCGEIQQRQAASAGEGADIVQSTMAGSVSNPSLGDSPSLVASPQGRCVQAVSESGHVPIGQGASVDLNGVNSFEFAHESGAESCGGPVVESEAATPNLVADLLVDGMPTSVENEFAQIAAESSVIRKYEMFHLRGALDTVDSPKISSRAVQPARRSFTTGGELKYPRGRLSKVENDKRKKATPETANTNPVLSEENRQDLKIITTALISDMLPRIQRLAASDPRIRRFSFEKSKRFKDRVIKDYKALCVAKRKSEITVLETALRLSKNSVSSVAYATVRGILQGMGHAWALPTVRDVRDAKKHLEECAKEDLKIYSTQDGWFASIRSTIEMELLRMMQMPSTKVSHSRNESGSRLIGYCGPDQLDWQDEFHVKITLDARSITKKTSHTEIMLHIYRKGRQGEEESQKSLCMRTVGIFMGKDSRENVQANMTEFFKECNSLAGHGVVFNKEGQTFLGQLEVFGKLSDDEKRAEEIAARSEKCFHPVAIKLWLPADMAAQCAVIGHGCGGHHYCAHCIAHEEERHLPYSLITVDEDISLQALAKKHDMHARTLYAINAAKDHKGVQRLTREGLRNSTAMDPESRARARARALEPQLEEAGARRPEKRAKVVPVAKVEPGSLMMGGTLVGWKSKHSLECNCDGCKIPKGTCVRVIPRFGFCRPSEFLKQHFPFMSAERMPFCALHCLMRVTEALFHQICQAALTTKPEDRTKLINRMNAALKKERIKREFRQHPESEKWEKVSFEGHQAKALLKIGDDGKMVIEHILEAMWPGAAEDKDVGKVYGTGFVPRVVEVWRQWAVVVDLMSERFSDVLLSKTVEGLNGYERFGMECREFIFRFQAMSTEDYSKSYYLHTLLHHAGDFMRELKKEGMTLGMMSNSGAERRHEYGRRASRKALASNGWRKKCPEYDKMPNLLVYITLKEIMMWDYGGDLISHELARLCKDGESHGPRPLLTGGRIDFQTQPRRALAGDEQRPKSLTRCPLLSEDEMRMEHDAQPFDPPPTFETGNSDVWKTRVKNEKAYAMIGVVPEDDPEHKYETFDPDHEPKLTSLVPVVVSDDEGEGSDEDLPFFELTIGSFEFFEREGEENEEDFEQDREFQVSQARSRQYASSSESADEDSESETRSHYGLRQTGVRRSRTMTSQLLESASGSALQSGGTLPSAGPEAAVNSNGACTPRRPASCLDPAQATQHDVTSAEIETEGSRRPAPPAPRLRATAAAGRGAAATAGARGGGAASAAGTSGSGASSAARAGGEPPPLAPRRRAVLPS